MTKTCSSCGHQNNDTAKFCPVCGKAFVTPPGPTAGKPRFCPHCGTQVNPTAKFCRFCSQPLNVTGGTSIPQAIPGLPPVQGPKTGKLPPNTFVMNRYRIQNKLGAGGMGAVYLATDAHLNDRLVALKEMSASGLKNPAEKAQAVDAFKREAQLLSSLNHPNIPRVSDFFEDLGKQFLVMDYVEGKTLEDLLDAQTSPFSESQVLSWAEQLCSVLTYLHNQKQPIIFRDLKPANVMISPDLKHVKLIDFGIVRFFKPMAQGDTMKLGTPGYAPPEQYGKGGQTDSRSDVYALGALLHCLLTKRDPGTDPFKFPTVRSLNSKVSTRVESAIMKAVENPPDKRWQTAEAFWQALCDPAALPAPAAATASSTSAGTPPGSGATQLSNNPPPPIVPIVPPGGQASNLPVVPIHTPSSLAIYTPAPHGRRIAAYFADSVIIGVVGGVIYGILYTTDPGFALVIASLVSILYLVIGNGNGQTLGKKWTNLRVIDESSGDKIGFWRSLWRLIAMSVPPVLLSLPTAGVPVGALIYLLPLANENHRALHDFLAKTKVVEA